MILVFEFTIYFFKDKWIFFFQKAQLYRGSNSLIGFVVIDKKWKNKENHGRC